MFFCSISGSTPQHPVISKTGHVFERSLIEKYIDENGRDPLSGDALTKEDLIEIKASPNVPAPRAASASSIPALLSAFQSEWDSVMLESLALKTQYQATRQELAHALYREDASIRVVARLLKERDSAREALVAIQSTLGLSSSESAPVADVEMEETAPASPTDLEASAKAVVDETQKSLSATRKKRKAPAGYTTAESLSSYTETSSIPSMHATKPPGVSALDISADGFLTLTGGNDKVVQVYDRAAGKVVSTLKGHTKKVTHVSFVEVEGSSRAAVSSGAEGKAKVWTEGEGGKWALGSTIAAHKQEITGLALHPSKKYFSTASLDSTWAFHDIESGSIVQTFEPISAGGEDGSYQYSSFAVHPDGPLHGGGTTDGVVRIWDVRDKTALAATVSNQSGASIPSLSFSENGYHMAVANSASSSVDIFDLRKLSILHSIVLPTAADGGKISSVRFDAGGLFLAVAGTDLRVFKNKTWDECLLFDGNAAELTDVRFGANGQEIVVSGADRTVRVLGAAAA